MLKKTLIVDLPADLYREFVNIITESNGCWREEEAPKEALEMAVASALMIFLHGLRGRKNMVELHDIVLNSIAGKRPELKTDGWN